MYISYALLFCVFLSSVQFGIGEQRRESLKITDILNGIFKGYDKRVRPNYSISPVEVGVTMYVLSISSISEINMDYTMDVYFRQHWKDERLSFEAKNGLDYVSLDHETSAKIWVPDTFFANVKNAYYHMTTIPNIFTRVSTNGDISRSVRLTLTSSCPMNLQYFPMDTQLCPLEIESYGYRAKDIFYKWNAGNNSIGISPDVELPQFRVSGHISKSIMISLSTGNYSRLSVEFQFVRSIGYYILQIYFPACLIVIVSWVSFWLNRTSMLARVALSITTVLTITTLMSSINASLPKISYIKSIDVYLISCFFMVFSALIEQAIIEYVTRRIHERNQNYNSRLNKGVDGQVKGTEHEKNHMELINVTDVEGNNVDNFHGVKPSDIDKYSQLGFPIVFLVFNIFYCIIYATVSNVTADNLIHLKT